MQEELDALKTNHTWQLIPQVVDESTKSNINLMALLIATKLA